MPSDKNDFHSAEALGPAYERPQAVTDVTIEVYLRPLVSTPQRVRDLERVILRLDNGQTVRVESKLKDLQAPTLIVWGTGDIFLDIRWSYWLADTIPGATRRVEFEGARMLFPEERPEELSDELRAHWNNAL